MLAALTAASVRGTLATGARAGQRLRRVLQDAATGVRTAPLCFASRGFSLHAAARIAGPDRQGLERVCRYVARPALASGRLYSEHSRTILCDDKRFIRDPAGPSRTFSANCIVPISVPYLAISEFFKGNL